MRLFVNVLMYVIIIEEISKDEIIKAGKNALVMIYGGYNSDSLDKLRYKWCVEKVTKTTSHIGPHSLPPYSCSKMP